MSQTDHSSYFVHTLLRAHDWQHRPEFDEVCDWWRGGGRGICALVGMGGAGKTAIAERFLRVLPGGLPEDPDVPKDKSLPTPDSTFVFSFYDAPNAEAFFEALQMWLQRKARVKKLLTVGQLLFLLQQTPGLVVLDGLERVQEDGSRGVFGRLTSPKLRDFLDHLAAGNVPDLSVLVTSRFPLADLRDARPQFFRTIPVDQIDLATGVQLLRDRGVRGTDPQLEPIVQECGRHALTVDFAGGYIAEYGNGDPTTPLDLGTAEELQAAADEEPDDAKRAVLKQGRRFARIAEHYREAMLKNDEAALALLERICLFRLGVDSKTLAAIFTGSEATKVSGKALAGLNVKQLQKKLDWLVRMRIVEESESSSSLSTLSSQPSTLYSIHPAVRDGFLSEIGREAAQASHEAVRQGLEVSLGDTPGDNPSDPATLDLLEEIVHHTLQSGHVEEAWDIYRNRIGGFQNLGHRLGAYERGERICRAFAGGEAPENVVRLSESQNHGSQSGETILPYLALSEHRQTLFINEWALYLDALGRLAAAARCYELNIEMRMRQEKWKNASIGNQNLCGVWLLSGRLTGSAGQGALSTAAGALQLAERADDAQERRDSHAYRAHVSALGGDIPAALADFRDALHWQHKVETHATDRPLYSGRGISHNHLLAGLGRRQEATRMTEANQEICLQIAGSGNIFEPQCNLVLSDLAGDSVNQSARESLCNSARDWAVARDAKEVLCWSSLVQARLELAKAQKPQTSASDDSATLPDSSPALRAAESAITEGLKIARDCGYGLYHIDLLLEQARLHLLQGNPTHALNDLRLALDDGIPANDETGQPELLAANHEECGYAWPLPAGLHLRAEAQLLQAAQQLGSDSFAPAKRNELPVPVQNLIDEAEKNLNEAMDGWQPLHDPEPERPDQNFKYDGKDYNYRAAETWRVLDNLNQGVLTEYDWKTAVDKKRFLDTFAEKLAKGGAKSLPIVGGILEEAIFGVMEAEDARKEAAKLQFALHQIQQSVDAQNRSLQELLQLAKAEAELSPPTERIIDEMSTEKGLADMADVIDRVTKEHSIDIAAYEGKADEFDDFLTEELRPEVVSKVALIGKLAEASHAQLTMLVAVLDAEDVSIPPQNRKTRASELVQWATKNDALPELIYAARSFDLKGFSRAIPDAG